MAKKKIAFLTAGLEPGADGVGDYSRLLARALVRQGHQCLLVALNDQWLTDSSDLTVEGDGLLGLRLPARMEWPRRIELAKERLRTFAPDWISLQFVAHGFQKKGILLFQNKWLARLLQTKSVHIMFHELWIGEDVDKRLKNRIIGKVQKHFVLKLATRLRPKLVHTSNHYYASRLRKGGLTAKVLPLFGNIPVLGTGADEWLFEELRAAGLDIDSRNRDSFWLFGLFGSIYPEWPGLPLFRRLRDLAEERARKIAVISIGRISPREALWDNWAGDVSRIVFLRLGAQPAERISQFLNSIDFGITTTPYVVAGKSGALTAMLEHGVPVIASWGDILPGETPVPGDVAHLIFKADEALGERLNFWKRTVSPGSRCPQIARQFIEDSSRADSTEHGSSRKN